MGKYKLSIRNPKKGQSCNILDKTVEAESQSKAIKIAKDRYGKDNVVTSFGVTSVRDSFKKNKSRSNSNGLAILIGIAAAAWIVFYIIRKTLSALAKWSSFTFPYKQVAAFYYYALVKPVKLMFHIILFPLNIFTKHLTHHNSLNLILAIIGILIIVFVFIYAYKHIRKISYRIFNKVVKIIISIYLSPSVLLLIYICFKSILHKKG